MSETKRLESSELKPCPFCGCAMSWKMINSHGQFVIVGDHKEKECPLFWMHWGGGIWENEKAAFSKDWNTRAVPEVKRMTFEEFSEEIIKCFVGIEYSYDGEKCNVNFSKTAIELFYAHIMNPTDFSKTETSNG